VDKLLAVGVRGLIEEAESGLERFRLMQETDISKFYFWQAAVIVCEAMIAYSRRYAALARSMAENEPDDGRRDQLVDIADICEWVPEHPARSFTRLFNS